MFKSYYCEKLDKTLHFLPDKIKFCCSCAEGPGIEIKDFSNIDKDLIIKEKKRIKKLLRKGIIPEECEGCVEYKRVPLKKRFSAIFSKKEDNSLIKHIIADHYKQCDCKCVYCSQVHIYKGAEQNYELLPLIKQLYKYGMIDLNELKAEFQGGSISVLKEFEPLMQEFYKNGCIDFVILMNGIKYMPILEKIGCNPKSHICISLDSGSRETFHKIKGLDLFEKTVENIKRLRTNSHAHIELKYIIVRGLNDNIDELKKFLLLIKDIGNIEPVSMEIDYRDTLFSEEKFVIPQHYYEMFNYAEKFCINNRLSFMISPYTKVILDKGSNK